MWIIAAFSIFVATLDCVSATATTTVDCSTQDNQVKLHPHPTSCTQYIQCVHGLPMARPCATGTEFSPSIGVCVHPWQSDCIPGKESNVTEATVVPETTTKVPEEEITAAATTLQPEQKDEDEICESSGEVDDDEGCGLNGEVPDKSDKPENNEECENSEESLVTEQSVQPEITTTEKSAVSEAPNTTIPVQASSNGYLYPKRFEAFDPNDLCGDGGARLPIDANTDCHFIICTAGIPISLRCPLGQYFDSHIGQCIEGQGNCSDD